MIETELPQTQDQKLKAADAVFKEINKSFGDKTVQKLDYSQKAERVPSIPTSLVTLDEDLLGVGGIPRGTILEIYGPESSGKTTLTLKIIAEAQKAGELAAFIDAEHALDAAWATTNGVKMDDLLICQPNNGEQALDVAIMLVDSGAFSVIVIDSVAALTPQAELDGEMGDSHMGLQARMMSQACRKLVGRVRKSKTIVIFINQLREKIGVMFGSPETTTGGKALKFYASIRIDVRRKGPIKEGEDIVGNKVKIKIVKNKVAAPFREAEFDLLYKSGFDSLSDFIDYAVKLAIIDKGGAWYVIDNNKIQGRDRAKVFLQENPEIYNDLYGKLVAKINNNV